MKLLWGGEWEGVGHSLVLILEAFKSSSLPYLQILEDKPDFMTFLQSHKFVTK